MERTAWTRRLMSVTSFHIFIKVRDMHLSDMKYAGLVAVSEPIK